METSSPSAVVYLPLRGNVYRMRILLRSRAITGRFVAFDCKEPVTTDEPARIALGQIGNLPEGAHIRGRVVSRKQSGECYRIGIELREFIDVDPEMLKDLIRVYEGLPARLPSNGPGINVPLYLPLRDGVYRKSVGLTAIAVAAGRLTFETSQRIPVEARIRIPLSGLSGLGPSAHLSGRVASRGRTSTGYSIAVEIQEFVDVDRDQIIASLRQRERAASQNAA